MYVGLGTSVLVLVVLALVAFRLMRGYSLRVEQSAGTVPDRLHRLRRTTTGSTLGLLVLSAAIVVVPLAITTGHHTRNTHRHLSVGAALLLIVVLVVVLVAMMTPMLAAARAVRPSIARLRDVPVKSTGQRRQSLTSGLIAVVTITAFDVLRAVAPRHGTGRAVVIVVGYALILLATQTLFAPLWVRLLRAKPLPAEAETRMTALARTLGVTIAGFRSYPGRQQRVANAIQIGLLPRLRYVLISDYLLENLTPVQADAVIAHELGHARGRHLLVKLGAVGAVWALIEGLVLAVSGLGRVHHLAAGLLFVPVVIAFPVGFVVVQGLVGVRLEERADDTAAQAVGADALVGALDVLAELNHAKRDTGRGWALLTQHPGITARIARLRQA